MAPKSALPAAKQNAVLTYLQTSSTAHSIKELEKSLPSAASVSGMQVKDYLQALSDEGKIRVEKIGSGNWYWSFLSEEKKNRDSILEDLTLEKEKIDAVLGELRALVDEAKGKKKDEPDYESLIEQCASLEKEIGGLQQELDKFKDSDPEEVNRKRRLANSHKVEAERWTDNIEILEDKLRKMTGGDRKKLAAIQEEIYGAEYLEDQGLREL